VGVGESERSTRSGKSTLRLAVEAGRRAMADAGFGPGAIDGVMSYQDLDCAESQSVCTYLGVRPRYFNDSLGGGSSAETLVVTAMGLIEAGVAKNILIYRSLNGRSGGRMGGGQGADGWSLQALTLKLFPGNSFIAPYGVSTPADQFGLIAMRHMLDRGITAEHLGAVCVTQYGHAQLNPAARFYGKPLTLPDYLASPYVTWPFRIHDYCTETDEANAIIVTSAEAAADCRSKPVFIKGVSGRQGTPNAHQYSLPDPTDFGAVYAAREVFRSAGVSPSEIDIASLYDCFSWVVLAQLEAYGFVKRGEAGPFAAEGNLGLRGRLPTNTSGGMLAEGYTHGMNNLIELVRQLRHEYSGTDRQVDCELGLCAGWGGPRSSSALILSRS
jgi:acetyl-CoA acetyltransferase